MIVSSAQAAPALNGIAVPAVIGRMLAMAQGAAVFFKACFPNSVADTTAKFVSVAAYFPE